MKLMNIISAAALTIIAAGCTEDSPVTNPPMSEPEPVVIERGTFARGADVSWLTELEAAGYTFADAAGNERELMSLLRDDCGINAIRLRVWVNPENDPEVKGWCDIDDMVLKARRANALGLRVMVDFHFSDTWADPAKQYIPAAWADMTLDEVKAAMTAHVSEALTKLQHYGVEPEWVQIGNETRTGMMWPLGSTDNGDNFTQMVNAGHDAVKAVFPGAKVIVHVDCGDQLAISTRLFDKLKAEGARYDMIGLSLYPVEETWAKSVDDCAANASTLASRYGKPVMLVEIGFDYSKPDIASQMLTRMMTKGIDAGLQGIFWWEPEAPADRGYLKGCFDGGAPTSALNCFKSATDGK